ncbi:hypothetical protein AVEN_78362-1 [Araneus ventricosus]|uniref:Uncharacterized protein n=1 Tax=Araneus ventricosus TaxID=182803 RepID=A0A4Y2N0E5_ARAVE|nr:hypothetical protein AVEN_78362-1 [Araneus ventricosus]
MCGRVTSRIDPQVSLVEWLKRQVWKLVLQNCSKFDLQRRWRYLSLQVRFKFDASNFAMVGLEGGGGLITAGESSKSSDMLYSKASSSDAEEELISASASDSRDCNILFPMEGEQPLVKAQCQQK